MSRPTASPFLDEDVEIDASGTASLPDPEKLERANRTHRKVQNDLAKTVEAAGLTPLRPEPGEPEYDIAWRPSHTLYVAEVKSVTAKNEEAQLRRGIGQVLRYRQQLQQHNENVIAVLIPEREPRDSSWLTIRDELGVLLTWPGKLDSLVRLKDTVTQIQE